MAFPEVFIKLSSVMFKMVFTSSSAIAARKGRSSYIRKMAFAVRRLLFLSRIVRTAGPARCEFALLRALHRQARETTPY